MNLVNALIKHITSRFTVRPRTMPLMVKYLKAYMEEERNFAGTHLIPDSVALVIVQEAYRRAALKEKDGRARYGGFDSEVERAADSVVAAFMNEKDVDPRIKGILVFHKIL